MAEILFVKNMPLGIFYFRRFSRIYPALILLCTILYLNSVIIGQRSIYINFPEYIYSVSLIENYFSIYGHRTFALDHIWSLCIEEHMYLLLGGIAVLYRWKKLPIVTVTTIFALLFMANGAIQTWWAGLDYYAVYWRSDVRGASILISVTCFLLLRDRTTLSPLLRAEWLPVCLALCAFILNIKLIPDPIKYSVGTTLLAASLALLPQAPTWFLSMLESPVLIYMGIWSYSLYIVQQPFLALNFGGGHIQGFLKLPIIFICGLACFYFVERPARRFLNRERRSPSGIVAG